MDVSIHRLEPVIRVHAIHPLSDRRILAPLQNRRPVPGQCLEIPPMLPVVRMLFQPVKGVPGHLQGRLIARHLRQITRRVNHKRKPIQVLLRPDLRVHPPVSPQHPVKPSPLLVSHHLVQKRQPMPRIPQILLPPVLRIIRERRRRPRHPRLVHHKHVRVRQRRPVPRIVLMKAPASLIHRRRIPPRRQLLAKLRVHLRRQCRPKRRILQRRRPCPLTQSPTHSKPPIFVRAPSSPLPINPSPRPVPLDPAVPKHP